MAELEARLMAGATEKIQLGAFLAIFQVNHPYPQFTISTSIIISGGDVNLFHNFLFRASLRRNTHINYFFKVTREMIKAEAEAQWKRERVNFCALDALKTQFPDPLNVCDLGKLEAYTYHQYFLWITLYRLDSSQHGSWQTCIQLVTISDAWEILCRE